MKRSPLRRTSILKRTPFKRPAKSERKPRPRLSEKELVTHPCDCKDYNGGQCYNCLNGAHHICDGTGKNKCKAKTKSLGLKIVVKNHTKISRSNRETAKLELKCDRLWAKIVKQRAGKVCQWSHVTGDDFTRMEAAHIFPRTCLSTRFDTRNGLCLSSDAHNQAHINPLSAKIAFARIIGHDLFAELAILASAPLPSASTEWYRGEYEKLLAEWRQLTQTK